LHVNFNIWSVGVGGGIRTVLGLANGLTGRGHKVTLTVLGKGNFNWFGEIKAEINQVETFCLQRSFRRFFMGRWDFDYAKALTETVPDCDVNVATYFETVYPTFFSEKGSPFYLIQHYEPWLINNDIERIRAEFSYKLPLKKLVVSHWLQKMVGGTYVGNGVDIKKFKVVCGRSEEPSVLLFRRGIEWKERIEKSLCQNLPYHVEIIDGSYSDEELIKAYSRAWLTVFLSDYEGFGLLPLESMACGTPVLVTDCLGLNEYAKHDVNALVVPKHVSLPTFLDIVKKGMFDSKLRGRLIAEGYATAKRYNFDVFIDRFEEAIK